MSLLDQKIIHKIALAMATSEGWMLTEMDMTNKHCQKYVQLATIAVETMQEQEEVEWEEKPWELALEEAKAENAKPLPDWMFTPDGECLMPHPY